MNQTKKTRYILNAAACGHCGRGESYVTEFGIPDTASNMMAAVRATTGVGHQDTSYKSHLDLADRFDVIMAELLRQPKKYVEMIKEPRNGWWIYGDIIEGMTYFNNRARELADATVTIIYPDGD